MPLLHVDWSPDEGKLRVFAAAFSVLAGIVGACLLLLVGVGVGVAAAVFAAGGAVLAIGLLRPPAVRPLYVLLTAVALPIGLVLSFLVLLMVYGLLVTPIGIAMRLSGRDPLTRRRDREADSYWTPRAPRPDVKRYFRQS